MKIDEAIALGRMQEALDPLDEEARKRVLTELLKNRCRSCFDYDPNGSFWCCYESRG